MKRVYTYLSCICAAATLCGCDKTPFAVADGPEIRFSVSFDDGVKAAGLYSDATLDNLGTFNVTGYDGSEKVIDAEAVVKSGDEWKLSEKPLLWQENHTMTFFASANMPSWASFTPSSASSATFAISTLPSAAAEQCDPIFGYYSGLGTKGEAQLTFNHPMTAVSFKTGSLGDAVAIKSVESIKSVTVSQVYQSASATVTGASQKPSYSWTSRTGSASVSVDFDGTQSAAPFILIPQTLSSKAVSLAVKVKMTSGSTETINVNLATGEWKSGIHYTYTLDYVPYIEMMGTLKVTLSDWEYIKATSGKTYFDANFDQGE